MTTKPIHSNHYVTAAAVSAGLRRKGYSEEELKHAVHGKDFTIGKPVELPGRKIRLGESGEYYYYSIEEYV